MKKTTTEPIEDQITKARMIFAKAFLDGNMALAMSAARAWHDLVKYSSGIGKK